VQIEVWIPAFAGMTEGFILHRKIILAFFTASCFHEGMTRTSTMTAIGLCAQKSGFNVNTAGIDAGPVYAFAESGPDRLTV
jgi:hypothetical protein